LGRATGPLKKVAVTACGVVGQLVYQRVENYVVQPLVYGRALRVNPLVTILSVLVGASLLGVLGALLALPIAAAIQIVLRDWWASRGEATGDPSP
jgi:predicted PurR-regulated permease PerM